MPDRLRPSTLEEVALWIAEHDGRADAEKLPARVEKLAARIDRAEHRLIYVAGAAAALGAATGNGLL